MVSKALQTRPWGSASTCSLLSDDELAGFWLRAERLVEQAMNAEPARVTDTILVYTDL